MSEFNGRSIEERFEQLLAAISELKRGALTQVAYTKKEAAALLGFSVTKLDRLIKAGVIQVCEGDDKMIPRAAIDAFARPVSAATAPRRSGGRPKKSRAAFDPKAVAAALRATSGRSSRRKR